MSWQTIVKENNLDVSVVKLSDIGGLLRIEAEYYKPLYLQTERIISNKNYKDLDTYLIDLYRYPTFFNIDYFESGTLILKGEDISESGIINNKSSDYIDEKTSQKFKRTILKKNDLIMSVRGLVGKVGLITDEYKGSNINANVIKLSINENLISPIYVWLFLNCFYGRNQIYRYKMQTNQETIISEDIRKIKIPTISETLSKDLNKIVEGSLMFLANAKKEYIDAEQALLKETNLANYKPNNKNTSVRSLAKCLANNRFDAEYWQLDFDDIINLISGYKKGVSIIGNEFKQIKNNFKKDPKKTYKYIEISDVNISTGEVDFNEIIGVELPANAKIKFGKRQLITSKVRPNRGATAILDNHDGYIGSGAFTVLQEKETINLETLMVYLKTRPIRELLLRYNTGTSYPTITDRDILQLPIPLIDAGIQKQIKEKIAQSHTERQEAKKLLEKAKRAVEIFIEQNEKQALAYLNK